MATESTRVDERERRSFSVEGKRRIVAAYRAAVASGDGGGVVLCREGIYQSLVFKWGRQIDVGTLGTRRRGPTATGKDPVKIRVRELEEQLQRARGRIDTLEELVSVQGKCLALHAGARTGASATSTLKLPPDAGVREG